jgi:hypothetical protein
MQRMLWLANAARKPAIVGVYHQRHGFADIGWHGSAEWARLQRYQHIAGGFPGDFVFVEVAHT